MKRILIDVDTQFDFMHPDGSLYVPAEDSVLDAIKSTLMQASFNGIGDTYDAVLGSVDSHAYDAWEFKENGGPFPAHCVKGQRGWLRLFSDFPKRQRFIPMTEHNSDHPVDIWATTMVGEAVKGQGSRRLNPFDVAEEALEGKIAIYFEKEVYSLFSNPFAKPVLRAVGGHLWGSKVSPSWKDTQIDVMGYCAGGYCVDAAVKGLLSTPGIQDANIRVLAYATAAIGGEEGMEKSRRELTELGAEWVESL